MTYFLEKNFIVNEDGSLVPAKYCAVLVRPCEWDYETCVDFMSGKKCKKYELMTLNGQIAEFAKSSSSCKSLEEWLICLELEKGIKIDFEVTYICTNDFLHQYHAKTIDMHTHEVIEDCTEQAVEHMKALQHQKVNTSTMHLI